jgi:hypothetical protein
LIVGVATVCLSQGSPAAEQLSVRAIEFPNEDYFWSHTRQESWDRVNRVYQEAVRRFDAEQKRLDDERIQRMSKAKDDAAKQAVWDWFTDALRELDRRRTAEYERKEKCQKRLNDFYNERFYRENSPDPKIKEAERAERHRREEEARRREEERQKQGPYKESPYPNPRELPEFKDAPGFDPEVRETPEFVESRFNLSAASKAKYASWKAEVARHHNAVGSILRDMNQETYVHLLNQQRLKDARAIAEEKRLHEGLMGQFRKQLREELERFEKLSGP